MDKSRYDNAMIFELLSGCTNNFFFIGNLMTGDLQWTKNSLEMFPIKEQQIHNPNIWDDIIVAHELTAFLEARKALCHGDLSQIMDEYHICLASGVIAPAQIHVWPIHREHEEYAGIISIQTVDRMTHNVNGLDNYYDFRLDLSNCIQQGNPFGLLSIGIDSLKRINELHSYTLGDEVLMDLAMKLKKKLPKEARLYRLDGDGFVLLYPNASILDINHLYTRCKELTMTPFTIQDIQISINFYGAGCLYPNDGRDIDTLLKHLRIVLNIAKNNKGSQFVPYTKEIAESAQREISLMERLKESVNRHFEGFYLKYQPLVYAEGGLLYGCEVLLRWSDEIFIEEVSPSEFIPLLENMGLMPRVGKWVLQNALHQLTKWIVYKPDLQMNINVTCAQFEDPEFRFFVIDCLCSEKLSPNLLTLELTESNQINDTDAVSHAFEFFRGQGIKVAFDDFGMGYASFDIFRVLSADELKIDKSFLERLTYNIADQKIITHLINLCNSMNMSVCVEGVETSEILHIIRQLGPKFIQGYFYNKPLSAEDFESFYFEDTSKKVIQIDTAKECNDLEKEQTLVYASLRPAQSLPMDELIDHSYAGILQVGLDEHFTFLTCNEGYRRMLGYTAKEMESKFKNKALSFVHPDDLENVNIEIRRQLGLGDTITIEFRIVRADGVSLWILGTGNVVKGKDGSISLAVVIIENEAAKRRQLKLEDGYKAYKKLLDRLPNGIKCVRFDENFTIDYISPAFLNLMGFNESELTKLFQNHYINLIYEEDRPNVINDVFEQLKEGNIVTLRYRTPCKDGRLIWVETVSRLCPPDSDGIQRCYSCLVDITDTISDNEKQKPKSLANRYQDAAGKWGDVLFEVDAKNETMHFSDEYRTMFNREPETTVNAELVHIHPDDRMVIMNTLKRAKDGEDCAPIEIRALKDGEYRWFSIYVNESDKLGETTMAILGKICDIHDEKVERIELLAKSQEDSLTGLYNKGALEEKIRLQLTSINSYDEYALFMIDIDDFKNINDCMGHPFGDQVLREIAEKLTQLFDKDALIGRVGGDEFMVFIKYKNDEKPAQIAKKIVKKLKGHYELHNESLEVSISVGGSCYPNDGEQFYDLFRRADSALYRSKARGKNQGCMFFEEHQ